MSRMVSPILMSLLAAGLFGKTLMTRKLGLSPLTAWNPVFPRTVLVPNDGARSSQSSRRE